MLNGLLAKNEDDKLKWLFVIMALLCTGANNYIKMKAANPFGKVRHKPVNRRYWVLCCPGKSLFCRSKGYYCFIKE